MPLRSIDLSLALRNVWRQRQRSAIAMAAVAFGIVALMLASGFIEWIYFDMRESTIHSQLGHVQVVRPGFHEGGRADPFRFLLPAGGPALDAISSLPGVRTVAPRLFLSGLASHAETTVSIIGEAITPGRGRDLDGALTVVQGTLLAEGDPKGVDLGVGLARNLGVTVGDPVVLVVGKASGGINAVELTVRGLFSTITKAYDDSALRLPIETARQLLNVDGAHAWIVLLDNTERTDEIVAALRRELPAREYQVVPWTALADFYAKTVALFSRQVLVMKLIIAAIIVLSISNTVMMGVMERTGEIGTSMALGVRRRGILLLFVSEGALLGVIGGITGIVLGLALALGISAIGIPMPAPPGMAHGFVGQIRITPGLTADAFLLAVVTTLAASLYPAWKASRLEIVDALRRNR